MSTPQQPTETPTEIPAAAPTATTATAAGPAAGLEAEVWCFDGPLVPPLIDFYSRPMITGIRILLSEM
jgi:hypothetical protein